MALVVTAVVLLALHNAVLQIVGLGVVGVISARLFNTAQRAEVENEWWRLRARRHDELRREQARRRTAHIGDLRRQVRVNASSPDGDVDALLSPLQPYLGDIGPAELLSYGALSEVELVWSWATIDPDVVRAVEFSTGSADVHSGFGFARYIADHYDKLSPEQQAGVFHRLVGYVGEQRYYDLMTTHGHTVVQAATANQPVWDFVVDGHLVNVKTYADAAHLRDVALAHRDVTYVVGTDTAGHLTQNMMPVDGLSHGQTVASLQHAIDASHGTDAIHAFLHHVPFVTMAFVAVREVNAVRAGKSTRTALQHGTIDVATRGVGAFAGFKAGTILGVHFGPGGVLVLAPVLAIAGGKGGQEVGKWIKMRPFTRASARLEETLAAYGYSGVDGLPSLRKTLDEHDRRLAEAHRRVGDEAHRVQRSRRWAKWPAIQDVATIEMKAVADKRRTEAATRLKPVVDVLDGAQRGEATALVQLGTLFVNAPEIAVKVGADPSHLPGIDAARQRVADVRRNLEAKRSR